MLSSNLLFNYSGSEKKSMLDWILDNWMLDIGIGLDWMLAVAMN